MYQTNNPANPLGPADKTAAKEERLEQDVPKLKDLVKDHDPDNLPTVVKAK